MNISRALPSHPPGAIPVRADTIVPQASRHPDIEHYRNGKLYFPSLGGFCFYALSWYVLAKMGLCCSRGRQGYRVGSENAE